MRLTGLTLAIALTTTAALAQQPAADAMKLYTSSPDVVALIAKAKATRKEGQANVIQPLIRLAPYTANLEYRASVGPASVHEKEAELFYVIEGSGTMVTGGKLTGESRTNAENLSGTGVEGGKSQAVTKGDVIMVPQNTPHWFSAINGTLVLMSIHVPRT
jgi:mannose-6-phosphate isomerase-like protein (cupin superfamily)